MDRTIIFEWELDGLEADYLADAVRYPRSNVSNYDYPDTKRMFHADAVPLWLIATIARCWSGREIQGWIAEDEEIIYIMDEKDFQDKLQKALDEIRGLPKSNLKAQLIQQANDARQQHLSHKDAIKKMRDTIDLIRVQVKYLLFDLEATRRENDYLRRMLDDE